MLACDKGALIATRLRGDAHIIAAPCAIGAEMACFGNGRRRYHPSAGFQNERKHLRKTLSEVSEGSEAYACLRYVLPCPPECRIPTLYISLYFSKRKRYQIRYLCIRVPMQPRRKWRFANACLAPRDVFRLAQPSLMLAI